MASENSRIKLLEREQVAPEAAALYDVLRAQRGVVPNMFKVLSYSPEIAKGVAGFLKPMLSDGALPGWYKELIAVRISILCESQYAIRAHSASARQKGASEAQISSVSDFENGPYTEKEKLGLRLADRLHRGASQIDRVRGHRHHGAISRCCCLRIISSLHRRLTHSDYAPSRREVINSFADI